MNELMTAGAPARTDLLDTPLSALRIALRAVETGASEGLDSARRIAVALQHTAAGLELHEVEDLAVQMQCAEPSNLYDLGCQVVQRIAEAPRDGGGTILIVEDDRLSATVMADVLREEGGRTVVVAPTGAAALEHLDAGDIALIILDLVLPDMDGRELLIKLREDHRTAGVPVLVITALQDVLTHAECFGLGAVGFLAKPIDAAVLNTAVGHVLKLAGKTRAQHTDALTGLPNRDSFEQAMQRVVALARRFHLPLCVAIVDLDRFKAVNDRFGHQTGDDVLRATGKLLLSSLRASDHVGRWGGEEFAVLLPNTSRSGAVTALEHTLECVRNAAFHSRDGSDFSVTFSAGVVEVDVNQPMEAAFAAADRLLYLAKSAGRNRVISVADLESEPKPKILLAEDDPQIGPLVQRCIESGGYEVVMCVDGVAALAAAAEHDVSLALLDVRMPGLDGFQVLDRLRQLPKSAHMPVMMLTGAGAEEDVVHAFEHGANDYIVKPFSNRELLARIHRQLTTR